MRPHADGRLSPVPAMRTFSVLLYILWLCHVRTCCTTVRLGVNFSPNSLFVQFHLQTMSLLHLFFLIFLSVGGKTSTCTTAFFICLTEACLKAASLNSFLLSIFSFSSSLLFFSSFQRSFPWIWKRTIDRTTDWFFLRRLSKTITARRTACLRHKERLSCPVTKPRFSFDGIVAWWRFLFDWEWRWMFSNLFFYTDVQKRKKERG